MKTLISLLFLLPIVIACASGPSKSELDAEVKRLCAIDGGIKVYETVKLPPDQFDKWGMVKLYSEQRKEIRESRRNDKNQMVKEFALGDAYIYRSEDYYYHQGRQGGATMVRYKVKGTGVDFFSMNRDEENQNEKSTPAPLVLQTLGTTQEH